MDLTKFISEFLIVTVAVAAVLVPRAVETYLAVRQQRNAEQAEE